jgi:putative Ca2+/H+ antiporter (TMEM165/GDT1 family)
VNIKSHQAKHLLYSVAFLIYGQMLQFIYMLEFLKIFFLILAEEIGDKSQLATVGFAANHGKWLTFFASALALMIASFVASFAGDYLQGKVSAKYLHIGSGILFIIIGFWILLGVFKGK